MAVSSSRKHPFALAAAGALALLAWLSPGAARAEGETVPPIARDAITVDRTHSIVDVGLGALSLPKKDLCIPTQNACAKGDLTLLGSLRYLVRWNRYLAAGAGVSLGFRPVSDDASISSPDGTIERTHKRNYYMLGGLIRYYLTSNQAYDLWFSAGGGLIVISDRYELASGGGSSVVNPRSTSVATEGPMVGVSFGGDYGVTSNLSVGGWTHEMIWFLPDFDHKACAATNDCATVWGKAFSFEMGLALTYRTRIF